MSARGWRVVAAAASVLIVAAAGCGGGESDVAEATGPAVAASTPSVWVGDELTLGNGPSPPFPDTLDGWEPREDGEWTSSVRVFSGGEWSPVSAEGYSADFPATMNGCSQGRTLVRWRAVNEGTRIRASWQHATAAEGVGMGDALTGERGWMILDGCQVPLFQLVGAGGESTLADVAVSVKQYTPAP